MRYINYYDNDTLSIFDKNTNKILANILLDKEDIPKVQKLHWRLNEKSITVRISDKHVGLMSYQKGGQLLDSISADIKIMPLIRIVLAIQFCYNVKYVR